MCAQPQHLKETWILRGMIALGNQVRPGSLVTALFGRVDPSDFQKLEILPREQEHTLLPDRLAKAWRA